MKKILFFILFGIHSNPFSTSIETTYSTLINADPSLQVLLEKLKIAEQHNSADEILEFTETLQKNFIKNNPEKKDEFHYFFDYLYKEKDIADLSRQIKLHDELLGKDKEELELLQKYKSDLIIQSEKLENRALRLTFQKKTHEENNKQYSNHSSKLFKEFLKPEVVGTWQALVVNKKAFFCYGCKQPIQKETGFHVCRTKTCVPEIFSCSDCYKTHLSPQQAFTCPTCKKSTVDHHLYPIAQNYIAIASTETD